MRSRPAAPPIEIGLILVIALAWRAWNIDRYAYDSDEVFSMLVAIAGWPGLLAKAAGDISHPPLFYALLKPWVAIGGQGELWARMLPALFGAATVIPAYAICRELSLDRRVTAFVTALVAINPFLVEYGQHLRMFTLLQLSAAIVILFVVRLVAAERVGARLIAALVIAAVLVVYSHYWGWFVLAALGLAILALRPARIYWFALACAVAVILYVPWILAVLDAIAMKGVATRQIEWMGKPGLVDVIWLWAQLNGTFAFARSTTLGGALFGAALLWGGCALRRRRGGRAAAEDTRAVLLFAIAGTVPAALTFAASHWGPRPVWGDRHLIIVALPYYLLIGIALSHLSPRAAALLLMGALTAWTGAASVVYQLGLGEKVAYDKMVAEIRAADPRTDAEIAFYTEERIIERPIAYYAGRVAGHPVAVSRIAAPDEIDARRFWFAFRDTGWRQRPQPEDIFHAMGYRVSARSAYPSRTYTVNVIEVAR